MTFIVLVLNLNKIFASEGLNVKVDIVKKRVDVEYPVIGDLSEFKDNQWQAEAIAIKLEKSLARSGKGEIYTKQYKTYRDKDFHEELSKEELKEYVEKGGVINFISHQINVLCLVCRKKL